jgi:uncharacterized protein (DUF885 family)
MSTVNELADEMFEALLDFYPTYATLLGLPGPRDRLLPDYREEAEQALLVRVTDIAGRADELDPATLTTQQRVTRAVIRQQAEDLATRVQTRMVEFTISASFTAPAAELLYILPMLQLDTAERAEAYLARLAAIPAVLAGLADRHRTGVAAGRLPVRHLVEAAAGHLDRYLANAEDPLARSVPPAEAGVDVADWARRRDELLTGTVRPAFAGYRDLLRTQIAPHGRDVGHPGLCWLPEGADTYARLIAMHTTTTRTADELHTTGLAVVEQLAGEYRELGARVFDSTDLAEIFERLRTDPALRWGSAEELLDAARAAITRAEQAAPDWFGRLPSQGCEVRAVPDDEAPGAPGAYYMSAALDGSRPGVYYANTYQVTERDRPQCESTAFHEAVPGHHFQLTLAHELTDLPMLRRVAPFVAYSEGWGLYSERLADEMGLYSDDLARLGMLACDSLRATRLVVDTGLHAKGWSREQAVRYMTENSPVMPVEIESEVDRYIAYPGQALAYMVGRLEIQRIRAAAEQRLGADFDIRAFHDTVLGTGGLPLRTLDEVVTDWVGQVATATS